MADERNFGRSLLLVDGDIAFEDYDGNGRLREVEGRANLLQALELRVLTPLGSDRFHTEYGLDYAQIFGSPEGLRMTKELIKLNLVRALATDPRVAEIHEIRFLDDEKDAARRKWTVEVELATVDASDVTLRVGIGA